jgi:F-type H+-transporting ATPase subunit c
MESQTLLTIVVIVTSGVGILISTVTLALVEGRAVLKALEGMVRQPEVANRLFTSLIVGMALLETSAIYTILVISLLLGLLGG